MFQFEVIDLPLAARLYRAARFRGRSSRLVDRLLALVQMRLFRVAAISGGGTGRIRFESRGRQVTAPFTGANLQFRALYMPAYRHGYEAATAAVLASVLPNDGVFYDVGSNWGFFSLMVAANPLFNGRVAAFEPNPVARHDLTRITAAAGLEEVISVEPYGLGSLPARLGMSAESRTHTGRTRLRSPSLGEPTVDVRRIDDLLLPPPHVMKIDVEGMEIDILEGGRRLIGEHKPFIVFEDWSNPSDPIGASRVFRLLNDLGYDFFVPVFAFRDGPSTVLVQHDEGFASLRDRGLVPQLLLSPFTPNLRPIMHAHLNFFACHRDRLHTIASLVL